MEDVPQLPPAIPSAALSEYPNAAIDDLVADLRRADTDIQRIVAPYDQLRREIRSRIEEIRTEQRRRERAAHIAERSTVRSQAKSGEMPTFAQVMSDPHTTLDSTIPLAKLSIFLTTGGEVTFGFFSKPGTVTFTNGRDQRTATRVGDAQHFYAEGWNPGTPTAPGVRVHMKGTRGERVVSADEIVVRFEKEADVSPQ